MGSFFPLRVSEKFDFFEKPTGFGIDFLSFFVIHCICECVFHLWQQQFSITALFLCELKTTDVVHTRACCSLQTPGLCNVCTDVFNKINRQNRNYINATLWSLTDMAFVLQMIQSKEERSVM